MLRNLVEEPGFDEIIYNKKLDINQLREKSLYEDKVIKQLVNAKFNVYEDNIELVYYKKPIQVQYTAPEDLRQDAYQNDGLICPVLEKLSNIDRDTSRIFTYDENHNLILNRDNLTFTQALSLAQLNTKRSRIRMLNQLYSYSLCNSWNAFVTLTFDRSKVDSSNFNEVNTAYNLFVKRLKYVYPDIKCLFVAEYHKDGQHIHFHGFLGNCPDIKQYLEPAINPYDNQAITDKVGNTVYNFIDNKFWDFGFCTLALLENGYNKLKVANYLTKYIGKDLSLEYGAKGLLHTRNLKARTEFNAFLSKEDLFAIIENYYAGYKDLCDLTYDLPNLSICKKETDSIIVFNLNYKIVEST